MSPPLLRDIRFKLFFSKSFKITLNHMKLVQIYQISKLINFSFRFPLSGFHGFIRGKGGTFRFLPDNVIWTFVKFINLQHHTSY